MRPSFIDSPVRADLEQSGGVVAVLDGDPVGCPRFDPKVGVLHVRRVAVDPAQQRQGIGTALMAWAHDYAQAQGFTEVRVGVRRQLPGNRRFYQELGYAVIAEHRHPGYDVVIWDELRRSV